MAQYGSNAVLNFTQTKENIMSKQLHIRLDDTVYEALADYNDETKSSVQDSVSSAIIHFLKQQNKSGVPQDAAGKLVL